MIKMTTPFTDYEIGCWDLESQLKPCFGMFEHGKIDKKNYANIHEAILSRVKRIKIIVEKFLCSNFLHVKQPHPLKCVLR